MGARLQPGPIRTPSSRVGSLSRAYATELAAAVLAGVRHQRGGRWCWRSSRLVFAPVTVSVPPATIELIVLAAGSSCLLALNLVLLRPAFRPLDELVETMRGHDPLAPGKRVRVDGGPDIAALAQTFNEMLDRLESERRESARRALIVQEGERQRIARELHDEVGQTLTGVMLQVEGLAGDDPRGAARAARRAARDRAPRHRGGAPDRAPAAPGGARGPRAAKRAGRAGDRVRRAGAGSGSSGGWSPRLPLSEEQELVVYRVAQEALTNVARHAERRAGRPPARARDDARRPDGSRRRPRTPAGRLPVLRTASAACANAPCSSALSSPSPARRPAAPRSGCPSLSTGKRMTTPLKTRILIADDHPIVLRGLRMVLNAQPDLEVVAEATDGEQAVERALAGRRSTSRSSTSRCRARPDCRPRARSRSASQRCAC